MTISMTTAQAAQQNNRDNSGRYATKVADEAVVDIASNADLIRTMFADSGMGNAHLVDVDENTVAFTDGFEYVVRLRDNELFVSTDFASAFASGRPVGGRELFNAVAETRARHIDAVAFAETAGDDYDSHARAIKLDGIAIDEFEFSHPQTGQAAIRVTRNEHGTDITYEVHPGPRDGHVVFRAGEESSIPTSHARELFVDVSKRSEGRIDLGVFLRAAEIRADELTYDED